MVEVFKSSFQSVTYHTLNAKRRLLQMPLVALRICNAMSGMGELYLMEKIPGVDCEHLAEFLTQTNARVTFKPGMTKDELKQLFTLTQTERERELIRYAIFNSSGTTPTEIRRTLGFECMKDRAARVESCIKNTREVFESIDNLAQAQEMALLDCLGYASETSSESSDGECEIGDSTNAPHCSFNSVTENSVLLNILIESNLNWFEFVERVEENTNPSMMDRFFLQLPSLDLTKQQLELVVQSHRAFASANDSSYEQ